MRTEIKIVLPFYKLAYAVFFIVILSLVRSVIYTYEIGIAAEPPMAILAAAFCADTYVQEITSKRAEIQRLYPMKKRVWSVIQRLCIQGALLLLLAILAYGLFFVTQNPVPYPTTGSEIKQFLIYLLSIIVTIYFWGILSNTISILFQNMWVGTGGSLLLWLFTNSKAGEQYLGVWNLFSYSLRDIENQRDFSWICGKVLCIVLGIIMLAALPKLLKKRG